ncbi:PKD domain-containing protein [Arthrobacter sp. Ld5]|uniref:PKD domain-containing protein n=1 Tax=Arthrobacter sp. Ld5 TaxID=649152 RepID=UPI003EB79E6E
MALDPTPAQAAASIEEDNITYTYVRACTAGAGSALDPATCPRMDAQCDAQDDGILVNWIEVDSSVQPATRTPTGRSSCMYLGEPPAPPVEGAEAPEEAPIVITLEEFQKQPVLAATIVSQPSNFGLRNAHSNVYAQAQEQEFTFEFQDAAIVLKARPVSYQWNYGDGTSATTTTPGGPVDGSAFNTPTPTSHQYTQTGDFELTLTTFFAGDYSVDGGPLQPVAGEAAVVSEPHLMSIWRTRGHNVSENCIGNPRGIGCEAPTR